MKDFFDIALIMFITLAMFFCMMVFSEEVVVQQEAIQLRNRIVEITEINGGYTNNAKNEVNKLIKKSGRNITVNVSKEGKLEYGEKIFFFVDVKYSRRLPFNIQPKEVNYRINGEFYNVNG